MTENNFKKLLCYNTIKNIPCTYKYKCLFAHNLEEQHKEHYRNIIHKMLYEYKDLGKINIFNDEELFKNLLIYTHECKNCLNNQCSGGYNCKYGVCLKELKICYNDLMYGKCINKTCNNKCLNGHHLTTKNLIPYYQYSIIKNININELSPNLNNFQIHKMCSVIKLTDENIQNIQNILNSEFESKYNIK